MFKQKTAPPDKVALETVRSHDSLAIERLMKDFMQQAGQATPDVPTLASKDVQQLRLRLIREELDELDDAYNAGDIVEVADGLTDLLYVILGSFVAHGMNAKALFFAVHQNNMDKLATGSKDDGGKFVKSPDHLPPDLKAILEEQWRMSPIRAAGEAVTCTKCKAMNRVHKHKMIKIGDDFEHQDATAIGSPDYTLELAVLCDGRRVKL